MGKDWQLELENLRLPRPEVGHLSCRTGRPRQLRKGRKFIKGPIPRDWVLTACGLPGKALAVATELWFLMGVNRSDQVAFNITRFARSIGVSRDAIARGLANLEKVRLVRVERCAGRKSVVTVLGYYQ